MTFDEILAPTLELLQRQGRVSCRALKRRFALDDDYLKDLKAEIIKAQRLAVDEDGEVLVWTGSAGGSPASAEEPVRPPQAYTPPYLAASAPWTPSNACSCGRAKCNLSSRSSRTSSGSMRRPRRSWMAWLRA
jgi:hypothetical protein